MQSKYFKHKGFTLAEVMVCLSILSVIASIMVTSLMYLKPNKSKAMFKKTFMLSERIVDELLSDTTLYPNIGLHGFDNVSPVYADPSANAETCSGAVQIFGDPCKKYEGKSKFAELFAMRLNSLMSSPACVENMEWANGAELNAENTTLTTADGVTWALPCTNFTAGNTNDLAYKKILIDINGNKKPNIMDSEAAGDKCNIDVDRYTLYLRSDGYIRVKGVCARTYLNDVALNNTESEKLTNTQMGASADSQEYANDILAGYYKVEVKPDGPDHSTIKQDVDDETVEGSGDGKPNGGSNPNLHNPGGFTGEAGNNAELINQDQTGSVKQYESELAE